MDNKTAGAAAPQKAAGGDETREAAEGPAAAASAAGAPESGPAVAEEPSPEAAAIERKLQAWLSGHIAGGPIARNTDCWNALIEAKPALIAELLKGD